MAVRLSFFVNLLDELRVNASALSINFSISRIASHFYFTQTSQRYF